MRVKLIYGVGINDADYKVTKSHSSDFEEAGKNFRWFCPFYKKWRGMLERCYSPIWKQKHPSYIECKSVPEWHYFMTFRAWMEKQDWEGKQLDKDILVPGNKIYSPETCVFVDGKVNRFLIESDACRGEFPIGVYLDKKVNKYVSLCSQVNTNKQKFLGYYLDPIDAHQAWLTFKLEQARILASEQTDPRVAEALIKRYENYGKQR